MLDRRLAQLALKRLTWPPTGVLQAVCVLAAFVVASRGIAADNVPLADFALPTSDGKEAGFAERPDARLHVNSRHPTFRRHTIGFGLLSRSENRRYLQGMVDARRIERLKGRASDFPICWYAGRSRCAEAFS